MIAFALSCGALILFSSLFFLLPPRKRSHSADEREAANLQWYHLRRKELADGEDQALLSDIQLRLLEDKQSLAVEESSSAPMVEKFPRWFLLPLITIASATLYYYLGAAPDVEISRQFKEISEHSEPEQMQSLIQAIELRSQQRPDNLHYRALLGRYYMGREDYTRAAEVYTSLAEDAPGDDQALAFAAQAKYLASNRELGSSAQMLAEQSLAINPQQRTALGLLGMASFESGQYRAAIEYWQRLLAMEPEGSESAAMIAGVIERAYEKLGVDGIAATEIPSEPIHSAGVNLEIRMPEGAQYSPSDTVFVLARSAQSDSRMPIAVQRLSASDLPLELRLDDSNSMAGQKLSEAESIVVVVQVSPSGQPGEANASWLGNAGPLTPTTDADTQKIVLRPAFPN